MPDHCRRAWLCHGSWVQGSWNASDDTAPSWAFFSRAGRTAVWFFEMYLSTKLWGLWIFVVCGEQLWCKDVQGRLCECSVMLGQVIGFPTRFRQMKLCLCIRLIGKWFKWIHIELKWWKSIKHASKRSVVQGCHHAFVLLRGCADEIPGGLLRLILAHGRLALGDSPVACATSQQGMQWFLMVSFLIFFACSYRSYSGFWWLSGRMISKTVLRELVFYSMRCTDCCAPEVLLAVHHSYLLTETTCAMASWSWK